VLPVGLVGEPHDVVADLARVLPQLGFPRRLVVGLHRVEIGRCRHLRIHDDVLPARKPDDEVGREAEAVGTGRFLDVEVAVLDHAGGFDHAAKLELAPLSADIR
jgi:hypothetical protein